MSSSTDQSTFSTGGLSNISPAVDSAYEPSESVTDSERSVAATRSAAASFTSLHAEGPSTMLDSIFDEGNDEASTATHVQANVTIQTTARGERSSSSSSLGGGDSPSDEGQTMELRGSAMHRIGQPHAPSTSILQRNNPARSGIGSIHDQDPRSEPLSRSRVERFHSVVVPTEVDTTAETTPGMRYDMSIAEGIYKDDLQVTHSEPKVLKKPEPTGRTNEIEPTRLHTAKEDYVTKNKAIVSQGISDTFQGVVGSDVRAKDSAISAAIADISTSTVTAMPASSSGKPAKPNLLNVILSQGEANAPATIREDHLDDDRSLSTLGEKSLKSTSSVKSRLLGLAKGTIKGASKASRILTGRKKKKAGSQGIDEDTTTVSFSVDHGTDSSRTGNNSPEVIDLDPKKENVIEIPITKTAPYQGVPQDTKTAPFQGVPQDTKTAPHQESKSTAGRKAVDVDDFHRTNFITDNQYEVFKASVPTTEPSDLVLWMMESIMPKVLEEGIYGGYKPVDTLDLVVQWILARAGLNDWDTVRYAGTKQGQTFASIRDKLEEGFIEWASKNELQRHYDLVNPAERIAYRRLTFFKFMIMHIPMIVIAHAQRVMESEVGGKVGLWDIDWRTSKILTKGWQIARTQADTLILHAIPQNDRQYLYAVEECAYERTAWERNVIKVYENRMLNTKRFEKPSELKKEYVDSPSDSVKTQEGKNPANPRRRLPALLFPDKVPPPGKTHYSGYFRSNEKGDPIWVDYFQRVDATNCPLNVPTHPSHWAGRYDPEGIYYDAKGTAHHPKMTETERYKEYVKQGMRVYASKAAPKVGHGIYKPTGRIEIPMIPENDPKNIEKRNLTKIAEHLDSGEAMGKSDMIDPEIGKIKDLMKQVENFGAPDPPLPTNPGGMHHTPDFIGTIDGPPIDVRSKPFRHGTKPPSRPRPRSAPTVGIGADQFQTPPPTKGGKDVPMDFHDASKTQRTQAPSPAPTEDPTRSALSHMNVDMPENTVHQGLIRQDTQQTPYHRDLLELAQSQRGGLGSHGSDGSHFSRDAKNRKTPYGKPPNHPSPPPISNQGIPNFQDHSVPGVPSHQGPHYPRPAPGGSYPPSLSHHEGSQNQGAPPGGFLPPQSSQHGGSHHPGAPPGGFNPPYKGGPPGPGQPPGPPPGGFNPPYQGGPPGPGQPPGPPPGGFNPPYQGGPPGPGQPPVPPPPGRMPRPNPGRPGGFPNPNNQGGGYPGGHKPPYFPGAPGGSGPNPPYGSYQTPRPRPRLAIKPDMSVFHAIRDLSEYQKWSTDFRTYMYAFGMGHLMSIDYFPPNDVESNTIYWQANSWLYAALRKCVKYPSGRAIITSRRHDFNGQYCWYLLEQDALHSTHAVILGRNQMRVLTTAKLDSSWTKPTISFITSFCGIAEAYNDRHVDTPLNDAVLKRLLEAAVAPNPILRAVSDREQERIISGGPPYSYDEYVRALEASATNYDQGRQFGKVKTTINNAIVSHVQDDEDREDPAEELNQYIVNQVQRVKGSRMNLPTWKSLSKEAQRIWDTMADDDKAKILQHASQRASETQVNKTLLDDNGEDNDPANNDDDPIATLEGATTNSTTEVNNVLAAEIQEAHPADPRRMMGSSGKTKPRVTANTVRWHPLDGLGYDTLHDDDSDTEPATNVDDFMSYWYDPDFHKGDW